MKQIPFLPIWKSGKLIFPELQIYKAKITRFYQTLKSDRLKIINFNWIWNERFS